MLSRLATQSGKLKRFITFVSVLLFFRFDGLADIKAEIDLQSNNQKMTVCLIFLTFRSISQLCSLKLFIFSCGFMGSSIGLQGLVYKRL